MLSPPNTTTRTPAISVLSELNHAASALAVYASQPASQQTTQDSLVSWWPTFAARDWLPAGLLSRFQLFITSSLAKLSWRNVCTQYNFVYAGARIRTSKSLRVCTRGDDRYRCAFAQEATTAGEPAQLNDRAITRRAAFRPRQPIG